MSRNAPNPRSVISLRLSPLVVAGELAAAIAILVSVLIIVHFWAVGPDRIPIHFGFSGKPDAWGDKVTILRLPAIAAILFVVLTAVSRYRHIFNYGGCERLTHQICLLFIHWQYAQPLIF